MSEQDARFVQLSHALGVGTIQISREQGKSEPVCTIDAVARAHLRLGDGEFSGEQVVAHLGLDTTVDGLLSRTHTFSFSYRTTDGRSLEVTVSSIEGDTLLIASQDRGPARVGIEPISTPTQEDGGLLTIFLSSEHTVLSSHYHGPRDGQPSFFEAIAQLEGTHIKSFLDERLSTQLTIALGQAQSTQSRQTAYFPSPFEGDHRYLKASGRWLGSNGPDLYAIEIESVSFNLTLNKVRPMDQGFIIIEDGTLCYIDSEVTTLVGSHTAVLDQLALHPPHEGGIITLDRQEEGERELAYSPAFPLGKSRQQVVMIRPTDTVQESAPMSYDDLQFITLLLDLSFQLLRTPRERADLIVDHILERLGISTGSDRTYIFLFEDDLTRMSNTHEWVSTRISREKDNLQDLPSDIFPQWMNSLMHGQEIYIHDVEKLPPSWQVEKDTLQAQDIKTVLVEPIITDTRLLGFIGFDRVREGRDWGYNERSLLSHFSHLLAAYFERTAQEKELNSALAMARRLAEEREQINIDLNIFYAKISHDIRTILNAIIGTSRLLSDTGLNPLQSRYMEIIETNNAFLLNLIRDILDFSLFGQRQLVIHELVFSLSETIDQIVHTLQLSANERGMQIIVDIDRAIPCRLLGDSVRISQILLNVIHNSIKYAGSGDVQLTASLKALDLDQATVEFTVQDRGAGMEKALVEAILSPSPSLGSTTRANGSGYGLGLSIVRQLSTALGGSLAIESAPGQGTAITMTITFKRPHEESPMIPTVNGCTRQVIILQDEDSPLFNYLTGKRESVYLAPSADHLATLFEGACAPHPGRPRVLLADEEMIEGEPDLLRLLGEVAGTLPTFLLIDTFDEEEHRSRSSACNLLGYLFKDGNIPYQLNEVGCKLSVLPTQDSQKVKEHYDFRGFKVLIVDDIPFNLEILEYRLKALNIDVSTANSGMQALSMVKEHSFDLILMDLMMPVMDGIETTGKIRALPSIEKKRIPVVAISASVSAEDEKRSHLVGIQDFLVKPVAHQELVGILAKYAHIQPTRLYEMNGNGTRSTTTIAGMDYQKALSITNGDEQLLHNLLKRFVDDWGDHQSGYRTASQSKNEEIRYFHSLLGVLSILHNHTLQTACEKLLLAVREGRDEEKRRLAGPFFAQFDSFVTSVRESLYVLGTRASTAEHASNESVQQVLNALAEPLAKRNLNEVRRLSATLKARAESDPNQGELDRLLTLLSAYDYAGALELIEQMGYQRGPSHA